MKLSLETMESISDWSNLALILSLVVGVVSTALLVWASNEKESYLKLELVSANASAEFAKAEAASANKIAAEINLEIAKIKLPRRLGKEGKQRVIQALSSFKGQKFKGLVATSASDALSLWGDLANTLLSAGWILSDSRGLKVGSPPAGISINPDKGVSLAIREDLYDRLKPQAQALAKSLVNENIDTKIVLYKSLPDQEIIVEIGLKN